MGEHQILGLMLVLQGILTIAGVLVGFQTSRETKAVLQVAENVFRVANETLLRVPIMSETQARTAATLERIEKRLDNPR